MGALNTGGLYKFRNFLSNCYAATTKGIRVSSLRKYAIPREICACSVTMFPPVKNYSTLKFMLLGVAATTGVPSASSPIKNYLPLKIYCCYCVCGADVRSISDS